MTKKFCLAVMAAWLVTGCARPANSAQQPPPASTPPAASAAAPSAAPAQTQQMPKGTNVNPDAGVLADFKAKVDAYDKLRRDLESKTPALKQTEDPAKIAVAEKAMAQQIRAARVNAKRGDIFTPATAAMFRRLLSPTMKGSESENKQAIKEDAPEPKDIPFKINGEYPKDESLSTMPPDVLKALPPLPELLQYRFVGKHLLLYCSRANLIVDYMLNAIP